MSISIPRAHFVPWRFISGEIGVKPELEVFDSGGIWLASEMIAEGLIPG
jgi:uncharacterized protein (DUF849 family)